MTWNSVVGLLQEMNSGGEMTAWSKNRAKAAG